LALPACVAWIVQVPALSSVTVAPDTVQTEGLVDAKLTGKPEDAVALSANGAVPKAWFDGPTKLMVWLPGVTVKL
jgi:hypothetical protein